MKVGSVLQLSTAQSHGRTVINILDLKKKQREILEERNPFTSEANLSIS